MGLKILGVSFGLEDFWVSFGLEDFGASLGLEDFGVSFLGWKILGLIGGCMILV